MKIAIVASGTRGDVQPYVALGQGLVAAGHGVRVLTSDDFATLVTEAGLEFASMGAGMEEALKSDEWRKTIEGGNFLKILVRMRRELKSRAHDLAHTMPDLVAGSDLILSGMSMMGTFSIAEKLNIPMLQAYLFPFTPTREFGSPLTPTLPFGKRLNRLSFHVTRQMFWQSTRIADVTIRRALGMGRSPWFGPFGTWQEQRVPVLYGYSRHVLPHPEDWDDRQYVTGYWFLNPPADWQAPAGLLDFLRAGEPPIYIGFGSMGSRNPQESTDLALEALARAGRRGVLASGWNGLQATDLPENVLMIKAAPHSWLFPQMAAVVHHGGAGTTAAGLRAGVPSIIVPFMGDQPFWGKRVMDLGVGPAPMPRRRLTAEQLATAITQTLTDLPMRQRAADLGARINAESGIQVAVDLVQQFAARRREIQHALQT